MKRHLFMDEIPKGTLVEIVPGPKTAYEEGVGVVLEWCSANVYEPASVQMLFKGKTMWIDVHHIRKVT
jgi:hypothetical protein